MKKESRKSVPHYTYRQSSKKTKRQIYKRIGIVLIATTIILSLLWFWGTNFINILGILAQPIENFDTTPNLAVPISKPTISLLPESTNQKNITVEGYTSPGEEVTLEGPTGTLTTVSESNGSFFFSKVSLKKGLNLIKVFVYDSKGEKLEESYVITLDDKPPLLDIFRPKDGETFPKSAKFVEVTGKTEEGSIVFINDLQVIINPDGQFSFNFPVKPGSLTLKIEATDEASNKKTVSVTIVITKKND